MSKPGAQKRAGLQARSAGYTILELLIVLAIVGLMAALAAPPFIRLIEQQRRIAGNTETLRALTALPMAARMARHDMVIRPKEASSTPPTSPNMTLTAPPQLSKISGLPEGWSADPKGDIWIRSDGVCYGGSVDVTDPEGRTTTYLMSPPLCAPVEDRSPATP